MKRVLVLQHEPSEGPGTLREALAGVELRIVRTFAGDPVPTIVSTEERASRASAIAEPGRAQHVTEEGSSRASSVAEPGRPEHGIDGLVVLGGGMGVYDKDRLPHLRDEIALCAAAMASGKPVLGICLGSQLLAAALGAAVGKAPRKEIGWHGVTVLPEARGDPLFDALPRRFSAFHWHGDAFTLPGGAVPLASTALTPLQAFRAGPRAWGIQFHLETDAQVLEAMLAEGGADLREAGADAGRIRGRAREELPQLRERALAVFSRWAGLL